MGEVYRHRRLKWGHPQAGRALPRMRARRRGWRSGFGLAVFAFVASAMGFASLFGSLDTPLASLTDTAPRPLLSAPVPTAEPGMTQSFALCRSGADTDCVVDGDTFRVGDIIVRIADIDTPETRDARCAAERARGEEAKHRLRALLNAGPFTLGSYPRDEDTYGRKLRIVERDGRSIGMMLVAEGLAREWDGRRHPWC
jgi:micrococcal nuclease